jgi:hypothetical protein
MKEPLSEVLKFIAFLVTAFISGVLLYYVRQDLAGTQNIPIQKVVTYFLLQATFIMSVLGLLFQGKNLIDS